MDAEHLLLVGYDFAPKLPESYQGVRVHRVAADKDLQIAATIKGGENEGGTFTVLSDLATELRGVRDDDWRPRTIGVRAEDGTVTQRPLVTVKLVGWGTYNPGTGTVRSGEDLGDFDAWMIDINHDGLSFESRLVYFSSGLANSSGFKALAKSLGRGRDSEAKKRALVVHLPALPRTRTRRSGLLSKPSPKPGPRSQSSSPRGGDKMLSAGCNYLSNNIANAPRLSKTSKRSYSQSLLTRMEVNRAC